MILGSSKFIVVVYISILEDRLFVLFCLKRWDEKKREVPDNNLSITWNLLAKRGAWTLFRGIWTFGVKVIEFKSFI